MTTKSAFKWKVIARHKWVSGCTITESYRVDEDKYRKFTATINGWRGFELYCGAITDNETLTKRIIDKVKDIQQAIQRGDDWFFYNDCKIS